MERGRYVVRTTVLQVRPSQTTSTRIPAFPSTSHNLFPQIGESWNAWSSADKKMFQSFAVLSALLLIPVFPNPAILISAVCAFVLLALQFIAVRSITRRRRALISSLALLSSPLMLVMAHLELPDLPASLALSTSMLLFAVAIIKKITVILPFAYLCSAVVAIAIGPLALAITLASVFTYSTVTAITVRHLLASLAGAKLFHGSILTGAVLVPYSVINGFPVDVPLTSPPWWFAAICLCLGCMPWTLFPLAVPQMLRHILAHRANLTQGSKLVLFACIWLTATLVTLAIHPAESVTFLLAGSPAVAIIAAAIFDMLLRKADVRPTKVASALLIALGAFAVAYFIKTEQVIQHLPVFVAVTATSFALSFVWVLSRQRKDREALWHFVTCAVIGFGCIVPISIYYFAGHLAR